MENFTHLDLLNLAKNENELKSLINKTKKGQSPNQNTLDTLFNYSKSLVIRKSKNINSMEFFLN